MKSREFSGKMALAASKYGKEKDYWLNKLSGDLVKSRFPYDYTKTGCKWEVSTVTFNGNLFERLMKVSKKSPYTLHMILVSALMALLAKYTGGKDIMVGMPIYNQESEDEFLNTALVLRNQLQDRMKFKELLLQVRQTIIEANQNQNYPLETLLYQLNIPFSQNDFPLFDVVLLLENFHQKRYIEHTHPNVIFSFLMTHDSIEGKVEYNALLYDKTTIERITAHFIHLLEKAVFNPEMPVLEIHLLCEEEKRQLLWDFNRTAAPYPHDKTIDELFRHQAEKNPDKVAVTDQQESLTYNALNQQTHRFAVYLQHKGLRDEEAVGIMAENNINMIVGILGILKAGGAYLPLNSDYPSERQKYLLNNGNVRKLLITTRQEHASDYDNIDGLEKIHVRNPDLYSQQGGLKKNHCHNSMAYIIYTSGSTGAPKGVVVEHRCVVRLVKNTNYVEFKEGDRILQTGALDFDASTFEIWGALLNGLQLHLASKGIILIPKTLKKILREKEITTIWMTSALFNHMVDEDIEIFSKLRTLLVGGDVLSPIHINRVRAAFPDLNLINGYGPTENTTFSVTHCIRKEYEQAIPIGKPIANSTAYIIDRQSHPVPIGVPGELCVGGDGLSRGYLNNPELTEEKFNHDLWDYQDYHDELKKIKRTVSHDNQFSPGDNDINQKLLHGVQGGGFLEKSPPGRRRLYRTGDLARWLPDGNIDFLGRIDSQVKIRGYRIEPGEIESYLTKVEDIDEAVVVDKESEAEKYLCAYVIGKDGRELDIVEVKQSLSKNLPDYMIPSYFVQIKKIPLTANGKVDMKALPDPELQAGRNYVAPRDETEKRLTETWSQVLGIEKNILGIDSNFFDLGGHSLKATLLIARIHKDMNVKIPLAELFRTPTIREIAGYIKELGEEKFLSIRSAEKKEYYQLSSAQKRLYVLHQMDLKGINYNVPQVFVLKGDLDRNKFKLTFRELIKHHDSFRTAFALVNEIPVQKIYQEVEFEIEYYDLTRTQVEVKALISSFIRSFDLSIAPLMRVGLIKEENKKHILMIDIHHIITDGTSIGILIKEFMKLYGKEELPRIRIQYKDFSKWQNTLLASGKIKSQQEYWKKQFQEDIPVLDLPTDYLRPAVQNFEGGTVDFEISDQQARDLNLLVLQEGVTLFIFLLSIYNIFLFKMSSQEDITVGIPIAGRRHADLEQIVGMFVNTLALRNYPTGEKTFKSFLKEVKENTLGAFENQDYPFEELVEQVEVTRDAGRNALFDVMFVLQNMDRTEIEIPGLKLTSYDYENRTSKFDLTLNAVELKNRLQFTFTYCTKLFSEETVERFIQYFTIIVASVLKDTGQKIWEIDIISEADKKLLLNEFNETAAQYPRDKTIHELFTGQSSMSPDNTALIGRCLQKGEAGEQHLTYRELSEASNRLAHLLQDRGVQRGDIVGLQLERSIEMMVGLLAILETGGVYLPIDPDYPAERIDYMLKDSRAKILLKYNNNDFTPEEFNICPKGTSSHPHPPPGPAASLAYIIYTSGSTGKPKGVMVNHRSLVNYIWWAARTYVKNEAANFPLFTSPAFDLTVTSLFTPLISGNTIIIYGEEIPAVLLEKIIEENRVQVIKLTPSHLRVVRDKKIKISHSAIKRFILGGEQLETTLVLDIHKNFNGNIEIYNEYGPTEATVGCMIYRFDPEKDKGKSVPVGGPISNIRVYIVDRFLQLLPPGVPGELGIWGDGLSCGYLNRPALTAEKFDHDLRDYQDYRDGYHRSYRSYKSYIYRSGDLARWLPDGNIEYLGRMDFQVKIRGFRIELGEIRAQLERYDAVREAVVVTKEDKNGEKYLCAYIVASNEGNKYSVSQLREYLSQGLPAYMIPSYFVNLGKIPLTSSGKMDKKALPEPDMQARSGAYIAPQNEIEEKLVGIWSEVLAIEKGKISIDDNFFHLGGHSLKATIVVAKIHKELKVKLPLAVVFKAPTPRALTQYIITAARDGYKSVEPLEKQDYYALSSAQKRLYTLQKVEPKSTAYNMPTLVSLAKESNIKKLEEAFIQLIHRHDSLRTSFHMVGDESVQRIHEEVEFGIEYYDLATGVERKDGLRVTSLISSFIRPFDLARAPLLRVGLITQEEENYILMADMHHVISDGVSNTILIREFTSLYVGKKLPPLKISYTDYSRWQNRLLKSGEIKKQENYWLNLFKGEIPTLDIPTDYARPSVRGFKGNKINFSLEPEETMLLSQYAQEENVTIFMMLLAIYNVFLSKISSQEDIIVGTGAAGRRHTDLNHIIGMFVNTLALRNFPGGNKKFKAFLQEIKKTTLEAFENQDYQYEQLVRKIGAAKGPSRNPLFDVVINFQTIDVEESKNEESLKVKPYEFNPSTSKFDLILDVLEINGDLSFTFQFNTELFCKKTMEMFVKNFKEVVSTVLENMDVKLKDIEISSDLLSAASQITQAEFVF